VPGILNWALDGLERVRAQGHFTMPGSAREAVRELEDLASPMSAFLRDRCQVAQDQSVTVDELWGAWKSWSEDQSHHHGTKQTFGRDLRAAVAGVRVRQLGAGQVRTYFGVGLRPENGTDHRVSRVNAEGELGTHADSRAVPVVKPEPGHPPLKLSMDWALVGTAGKTPAKPNGGPPCPGCGRPMVPTLRTDRPFVCTNPDHSSSPVSVTSQG
jgi:putative DNA primase/helicase